jgi:hypothetical protein
MMNDVPRQTLRKLIAKYGRDLCSDSRRCGNLLRDECGAYRREINILTGALKERIPLDLLAAQSAIPRELLLMRLAKRLEDQLALTEEAARWAVDSWALALQIVTDAQFEEIKAKRAATPTPSQANASTRLNIEGDGGTKNSTAPAKPQPLPKQQQPPPRSNPIAPARPANTPPTRPVMSAPPRTAGPTHAQLQTPVSPASPALQDTSEPAGYFQDPALQRSSSSSRWRGRIIGCFLFIVLLLLLFLVAPYVISLLRDEQQQSGPPPSTRPQ